MIPRSDMRPETISIKTLRLTGLINGSNMIARSRIQIWSRGTRSECTTPTARGLAGHARFICRLYAQTLRFFRAESGDGRGPAASAAQMLLVAQEHY